MTDQRMRPTTVILNAIAALLAMVTLTGTASKGFAEILPIASAIEGLPAGYEPGPICRPAPKPRPAICNLCARLYGGYLIVTGTVQNLTGDPNDWFVSLTGSILGTAPVKSNGDFMYVTHFDYPYGEVCARALGPNGEESLRSIVEFCQ